MGINSRQFYEWQRRLFKDTGQDDTVKGILTLVKRAIIRNVVARVLRDSPVLTGRFVNSWRASRNVPNPNPASPGHYARPTVAKFAPVIDSTKLEDVFYFTNGVHYAGSIAFGSSRKAPSGWIDRAIAEGVMQTRNVRL